MSAVNVILGSVNVQMKQTFARNMFRFCLFVQPLFSTVLLAEMYKNSAAENFTAYVILGSGLMSLWSCICFSSAGDINRERYYNTLSLIFTTPSDFRSILLGKILGNTLLSLASVGLSVVYAAVLYHKPIQIANAPFFVLAFFLTIACFVVISVFVAYLLTLSRRTSLYMNCLDIPLTLVCGFAFPVEKLPLLARCFSYLLPPTWAVKLMRVTVLGQFGEYWTTLLFLAVSTAAFGVLSGLLYKTLDRQVRINATLEMV
jgi:ABC-2 type transport system permease protein